MIGMKGKIYLIFNSIYTEKTFKLFLKGKNKNNSNNNRRIIIEVQYAGIPKRNQLTKIYNHRVDRYSAPNI